MQRVEDAVNVVLNIGLGDPPSKRAYLEWPRRLKLALAWALEQGAASVRFVPSDERHGGEPVLVVMITWTGSMSALQVKVFDLAELIEQECIALAVRSWDSNKKRTVYDGYLVGGGASKWEPFDEALFITWEKA